MTKDILSLMGKKKKRLHVDVKSKAQVDLRGGVKGRVEELCFLQTLRL